MKVLEKNTTVQEALDEIAASIPAIRKIKGVEVQAENKKYNEKQFKNLVLTILADENYIESDKFINIAKKVTKNPHKKFVDFLHKILKHAGMNDKDQRAALIDTFEMVDKDVEFILEVVDEAIFQYMDAGKTVRLMADKPMTLSLSNHKRDNKNGNIPKHKEITIRRKVKYNKLPE